MNEREKSESDSKCSFTYGNTKVVMLDKHEDIVKRLPQFARQYFIFTKPIDLKDFPSLEGEKLDGRVLITIDEKVLEQMAIHLDLSRKREYSLLRQIKKDEKGTMAPLSYKPDLDT